MSDRLSSFSKTHRHRDMSSHSTKINGTCFTNSRVRWMTSSQGIQIRLHGLHSLMSMLNGDRNKFQFLFYV